MKRARLAFEQGLWPRISLPERKNFLLKIAQGILEHAQELARLETLNTGKPIKESTFMDVPSAAETFKYFAENLENFLQPETRRISSEIACAEGNLLPEPIGVTALIVPWNYPLLIASWKLAQSLAAGNTVILKPASLTPLSALELVRITQGAGIPDGVVNIIIGSGASVGEALCADINLDLISFTGSNEVGKKIIGYTTKNVKKLIMELGGKSASIILEDADLEAAVNGSLCSIFLNQGQMCTAMSRIFIAEDIYDAFIDSFVERAQRLKLGPGEDFQTQMGPLISAEQRKKVISCVEKAKKEGAKVLCGGKIPDAPELKKGFFFAPTVLAGVSKEMTIFKEEIFGPVVCVNKFSTLEEAIDLANASEFALAACIWTKDEAQAKELASKINAGTIWINTYGMFFNELSYGGFKQSGFGKELGRVGFLEYTRLKNIVVDKTKESKPLVNYWYGF
ncbi:MAG: aldehyde dehydrogenase [Candidatus Omnitrophica bacterium]|nr:aldehyde dehydrogenase [Candidatus Omnitrophota bacterium]